MKPLTKYQKDILKEAANHGTAKAASILGEFSEQVVQMTPPQVKVIPLDKVASVITGPNEFVVGSSSHVIGDIEGSLLFIFPKKNGCLFIDLIEKKKPGTTKLFQDQEKESLKHLGKLLCEPYVDAFNKFLRIRSRIEITSFITTFGRSIADFVLMNISPNMKHAIITERAEFTLNHGDIKGRFILLLATDSVSNLLRKVEKG